MDPPDLTKGASPNVEDNMNMWANPVERLDLFHTVAFEPTPSSTTSICDDFLTSIGGNRPLPFSASHQESEYTAYFDGEIHYGNFVYDAAGPDVQVDVHNAYDPLAATQSPPTSVMPSTTLVSGTTPEYDPLLDSSKPPLSYDDILRLWNVTADLEAWTDWMNGTSPSNYPQGLEVASPETQLPIPTQAYSPTAIVDYRSPASTLSTLHSPTSTLYESPYGTVHATPSTILSPAMDSKTNKVYEAHSVDTDHVHTETAFYSQVSESKVSTPEQPTTHLKTQSTNDYSPQGTVTGWRHKTPEAIEYTCKRHRDDGENEEEGDRKRQRRSHSSASPEALSSPASTLYEEITEQYVSVTSACTGRIEHTYRLPGNRRAPSTQKTFARDEDRPAQDAQSYPTTSAPKRRNGCRDWNCFVCGSPLAALSVLAHITKNVRYSCMNQPCQTCGKEMTKEVAEEHIQAIKMGYSACAEIPAWMREEYRKEKKRRGGKKAKGRRAQVA
ncbi:hypothetical protein CONPUDRAFT_154111 [Coniophora puteana RWD-64-598 SS2]|uniref:Uncharacterized protein n=1 Tax=Coniophora puteana (strain RWD-64-598) TaxID=741705 RepID=A0A5M3MQV8_CONPW|nr:uncharacterized protein CONPUDRAFT_154111 [Coniophora puteana RWD-64-598 SS2]EIW81578.1 hypothetical protein CONPUDRAFT_154111 [Coniophora puteana RWD-64-598 SS2]